MVAHRCWAERTVRNKQCELQHHTAGDPGLTVRTGYVQKWIEVYRQRDAGNRPALMKALREATRGFVGVTDVPAVDFIGELIELYPEVKVSRDYSGSIPFHFPSLRHRHWGLKIKT